MTARPVDHARPLLTARRIEILRLYAHGYDTAGVAEAMFVSPSTVKDQTRLACQRLGAANRTQAVAVAIALGLLPLGDIAIPEPRRQLATGIPGRRWAS
ncbi:DNA-binding response regulator [Streptomyces sp. SDr-06]|uniref:LuxR C-terminal-related transcriptional regulator n=1 Tax=Streptomyces sp. SDr-06 TaxID=2267702 RepID=UPI000DEB4723|nr:LuxR C-terminal-related transcriptional regulator [Streptomyces sp. SDr-06]RCH70505.1 DNA-binding response regulator [Streptomyces sp. SDr-06]